MTHEVLEDRRPTPWVPEGLGHTTPKTPSMSNHLSEAHKKALFLLQAEILLCSLPPCPFSLFSLKQPCEQGLKCPPTCPHRLWITDFGIECLHFSMSPAKGGCVSQGKRSYCLTKTCHILYVYNPPYCPWEGAAVAHSSVLVCVSLVMHLYIAVRESCSSSYLYSLLLSV